MIAVISEVDVGSLLGTILGWFALIVIIALVVGAVTLFLKIYFFSSLLGAIGPKRSPEVGKQCQNCRGFSPQDSRFCKNCGNRF